MKILNTQLDAHFSGVFHAADNKLFTLNRELEAKYENFTKQLTMSIKRITLTQVWKQGSYRVSDMKQVTLRLESLDCFP